MSDDIEEWIENTDGMNRGENPNGEDVAEMISGGWNYRLIRRESEVGETVSIHEVYYDSDGEPRSCTKNPVGARGESVEDAKKDLRMMEQAFDKPVLQYDEFQ